MWYWSPGSNIGDNTMLAAVGLDLDLSVSKLTFLIKK